MSANELQFRFFIKSNTYICMYVIIFIRYGRRPMFVIACVLQLITGVTVSLSHWFWFYVFFRFLVGFGTGGTMTTR